MFGPDDFEVQIQQENPPGIHACLLYTSRCV